jgi:23S rRNA pseudouridine1911/1915/1917 synthase
MARSTESWNAAEDGVALAAELHRKLEVSHRQAKGLIDAGCVKVAGEEARSHGLRLKAGDAVEVVFDPDMVYKALPKPSRSADAPFTILEEDKHLIFVDKPAGLLTVPAEKHNDPCLAEALTDLYRRRGFKRFQLFIAHRLDRYTSGVLVFAKTPEALNGLKRIFDEHHLHRIYKAILVGELPENAGTLSDKLVERKSLRMTVVPEGSKAKHDLKGAKLAVTHYRVLERLPGHTVVEVKLETGRRNQIRVQFADRGFPLLGDQVYGERCDLIDRQALHAELLGFRHPVTGEPVSVSAPMPEDMEKVLKALRTARRVERAEAGLKGEEDLYKPKITKDRKLSRVRRAERFGRDDEAPRPRRDEDAPRPRRDGDAPRPRRDGDAPRPRRDGDAPRPRRDGDAPRPRRDGDAPRPRRDGDAPTPRRDGDAPRPRRDGDAPRPRRDGDAPRPRRDGDAPRPRRDGDAPRPRPKERTPFRTASQAGPKSGEGRGHGKPRPAPRTFKKKP